MIMVMTMGLMSVTVLIMIVIMIMSNSHMAIMHKCTERTAQIFEGRFNRVLPLIYK